MVNDGEPRGMLDPANAEFINAIKKGECPSELFPKDGRPVNVNLVRKETKYTPPEKPKYVAFAGQGLSLAGGSGAAAAASSAGVIFITYVDSSTLRVVPPTCGAEVLIPAERSFSQSSVQDPNAI